MVETVMFFKNVHIGITHFVIFNHLHVMMMMMMVMMMMLLKMKNEIADGEDQMRAQPKDSNDVFLCSVQPDRTAKIDIQWQRRDAVTAGCQIHRTKSMANLN